MGVQVKAVPAGTPASTITFGQSSIDRIHALKTKLNELQRRRSIYRAKLGGAAVTGLVTAPITMGASLLASSASNIHQRNH